MRNPIAQEAGAMQPYELDEADRRILRELQQDGALRNDVLAERIALTSAPTLRRVRALEKAGVISRYAALLDAERVTPDKLMLETANATALGAIEAKFELIALGRCLRELNNAERHAIILA